MVFREAGGFYPPLAGEVNRGGLDGGPPLRSNGRMPRRPPAAREPAIRVKLLPRDTNESGTIFGGIILSHIDLAAAVEAQKHAPGKFVTAAMREVVFVAPVYVGDLVSFYTKTKRIGTTSITVLVEVVAERRTSGERVRVTQAEVVYVRVNEEGRPLPVRGPG